MRGWRALSLASCPELPRLAKNTVRMAKGDPKKPKGKMSAYAFFVQTCREEHKKKTQRFLSVLQIFPGSALRGGRQCRGKRNLNLMRWQRQIKYAMIGK